MNTPFARLLSRPLAMSDMGAQELRASIFSQSATPAANMDEGEDWYGNKIPVPYDLMGTRVIPLFGPMTRGYGKLGKCLGMADTDEIRDQIIDATNDELVTRICLHVRSPGGDAQMCEETARSLQLAGTIKPTMTFCDEIMASASYYVGSASNVIYASPSSMIGNVGSYIVLTEDSEYWKAQGIEFLVMRSGKFKGAGIDGYTEEQLAEIQSWADSFGSQFREFVTEARPTINHEDLQGQIFLKNDLTDSHFCDFVKADIREAILHNVELIG